MSSKLTASIVRRPSLSMTPFQPRIIISEGVVVAANVQVNHATPTGVREESSQMETVGYKYSRTGTECDWNIVLWLPFPESEHDFHGRGFRDV